jgi:hypothetical protein
MRVIFEITMCKDTRCVFMINKTRIIFRHFQSLFVSLVHQASRSCRVSKQVKVKGTLRLRVSQFRPGVERLLGLMARLNTTDFQFGAPRRFRVWPMSLSLVRVYIYEHFVLAYIYIVLNHENRPAS